MLVLLIIFVIEFVAILAELLLTSQFLLKEPELENVSPNYVNFLTISISFNLYINLQFFLELTL